MAHIKLEQAEAERLKTTLKGLGFPSLVHALNECLRPGEGADRPRITLTIHKDKK